MSAETSSSSSGGIGLPGALTILFVGLKLTHYIDWSWWWILSPMLIAFALLGLVVIVVGALEAFK